MPPPMFDLTEDLQNGRRIQQMIVYQQQRQGPTTPFIAFGDPAGKWALLQQTATDATSSLANSSVRGPTRRSMTKRPTTAKVHEPMCNPACDALQQSVSPLFASKYVLSYANIIR